MAYSESLAIRIRKRLTNIPNVEEKKTMGGVVFMIADKMCVAVTGKGGFLYRVGPDIYEAALKKPRYRLMDLGGRLMKGWVQVDKSRMGSPEGFEYWITLALDLTSKLWLRKGIKHRNNLRLTKFLKLRKSL